VCNGQRGEPGALVQLRRVPEPPYGGSNSLSLSALPERRLCLLRQLDGQDVVLDEGRLQPWVLRLPRRRGGHHLAEQQEEVGYAGCGNRQRLCALLRGASREGLRLRG